MKLKTKLKLRKVKSKLSDYWYAAMKPVTLTITRYRDWKWDRFKTKVKAMTEDEIIDRVARGIIKHRTKYLKGCDDIHIAKRTDDWTERTIRSHMIDLSRGDRYVKEYGYEIKYGDLDTYRRLTEMLYDRLSKEEDLSIEWKVYDIGYYWEGYEKTLVIKVKPEYLCN